MFDSVGTVSIFVQDQDRAKAFYTETLGFELKSDNPMYPGAKERWLSVAPPGAKTEITLYKMDDNWQHYKDVVGKSQAVTFNVKDIAALHIKLKEKGVVFVEEPQTQHWGTFAIIEDSEGNKLVLAEV